MIPQSFDYHTPSTIQDALSLISEYGSDAKLLGGGHSLLPIMKLRLATPAHVIDLRSVPDLSGISESKAGITIGGMTTHYSIESSDLIQRRCPMLADCAGAIGDVQVRNRGTIGGSLVHADPAGDWPAAILAAKAEITVTSTEGTRTIKADEFFVDIFTTALKPDEILTEIHIPEPPSPGSGAYVKLKQKASGFAIAGVAVQIALDEQGVCQDAVIGIGGVAGTPYRATEAESLLQGQRLDDGTIEAASATAGNGVTANDDIHASAEYRLAMAGVFCRQALRKAAERADASSA